jgi:hypothetical protein
MTGSLRTSATVVSSRDDDSDFFISEVVPDVDFPGSVDLLLRAKLRIVDVDRHAHVNIKLPIVANKSFSDGFEEEFSLHMPTVGKKYKIDAFDIANSSQLWPN